MGVLVWPMIEFEAMIDDGFIPNFPITPASSRSNWTEWTES